MYNAAEYQSIFLSLMIFNSINLTDISERSGSGIPNIYDL